MCHEHHESTADEVFPGINGLLEFFQFFLELLRARGMARLRCIPGAHLLVQPFLHWLGLASQYLSSGVSLYGTLKSQLLEHAF